MSSLQNFVLLFFFHFIHPRWCILLIINNLATIVIHTIYNILLFTDFCILGNLILGIENTQNYITRPEDDHMRIETCSKNLKICR